VTPADGTLIVASVPQLGDYPLTAFVGDGFSAPQAVFDLNNLFDAETGLSAEVGFPMVLWIEEFRGLLCPGLVAHAQVIVRRVPEHEELAELGHAITELEAPQTCYRTDRTCDGLVDVEDVQRVLNRFNRERGDCAYNPDLDIAPLEPDGLIDVQDVQSVLNRFGESEPFEP
jgi:hypothetical protein